MPGMKKLIGTIRDPAHGLLVFLAANALIGIGSSVDNSTLTNYFKNVYDLGVAQRTFLEFPRELPGFLVAFLSAALAFFGDIRIAAIANLLAAAGMAALGFIPPVYGIMVGSLFVYSSGMHLYMPLANSVGMGFAKPGQAGRTLGRIAVVNNVALVAGSGILLLLYAFAGLGFAGAFAIGAASFLLAAALLLLMRTPHREAPRRKFVVKREFGLYYWLSVLYGARKQLFITFGPWVIVSVFAMPVWVMTLLFFIAATLGIFVKPLVGRLIDRLGERFVLGAEAVIMVAVCLAYAFAEPLLGRDAALYVVCACYVVDMASNSVGIARATYAKRIASRDEYVSPTLSLSVSIDHVMSMFVPMAGASLWLSSQATKSGYTLVFMGGAALCLLNFVSTCFMKPRASHAYEESSTK